MVKDSEQPESKLDILLRKLNDCHFHVREYGTAASSTVIEGIETHFSLGREVTLGTPDIVISGLDVSTARGMLSNLSGVKILEGSHGLEGATLRFIEIPDAQTLQLELLIEFYREAGARPDGSHIRVPRTVQLVWPDHAGIFPDEPGYGYTRSPQHMLGNEKAFRGERT